MAPDTRSPQIGQPCRSVSSRSQPHLEAMLPEVVEGDPTALTLFLAEGLEDKATGKGTSAAEMSSSCAPREPADEPSWASPCPTAHWLEEVKAKVGGR